MNALSFRVRKAATLLRWIPANLRGKKRLARLLFGKGMDERDVEITSSLGDRFRMPSVREPVAFDMLIDGQYEPDVLDFIQSHVPPGGTFVDVGANVGAFTIPIARHLGPQGRVLAIEASPAMHGILTENIHRNALTTITTVACAAHDRDDDFVPFWEATDEKFGMGSLAKQFVDAPKSIPCRTVDRLVAEAKLDSVHVMKVDVEGFEAAVFRGAKSLLTGPAPPQIVFEFLDWAERRSGEPVGEAQRILLNWGYRLERLDSPQHALTAPLVSGGANLVARRTGA
jgi:FkbM family methyltransferase